MEEVIKINDEKVIEKQFEYLGRDCIITFCSRGWRCGYVSLKDNEGTFVRRKRFGKSFTEIEYENFNIKCHGWLTFGDKLPAEYKPKGKYYVGFDCNHYDDGVDWKSVIKYGLTDEWGVDKERSLTAKSLEFCINECKSIVEQLNDEQLQNKEQ